MKHTLESETMAERATITFHTSPEIKARLDKLAKTTQRSKSFLTNKAVEHYLAEQEGFMVDVQAGLEDLAAGRSLSTPDLKAELTEHIAETSAAIKPV